MSDPKRTTNKMDADKSLMTSTTTTTTTTHSGSINRNNRSTSREVSGSNVAPRPVPAFTLPNGQIMDSKNTLQSFDASKIFTPNITAISSSFNQDNRIYAKDPPTPINYQSPIPITPSNLGPTRETMNVVGVTDLNHPSTNNPIHTDHSINVHAIPVQSFVVAQVETIDPLLLQTPRQSKYGVSFWLAIGFGLLLIGIIGGIGGYCGSGNCSPSETTVLVITNITTNPTTTMIQTTTNTPTVHPTVSPLSDIPSHDPNESSIVFTQVPSSKPSLTIACDFLRYTDLSSCQEITLFNESNTGSSIPTEIGLLTKLTFLDLRSNGLIGSIPSSIGNLSKLTFLELYSNDLNGTIPTSIGYLSQLTYLNLYNNAVTGAIPSELGNLTSLQFLDFRSNVLNSTIPTSIGNLVQLTLLDLRSNSLIGILPSSLGNLTKLKSLRLSSNNLSSTIPSTLGNLVQLDVLGLSRNDFTGTVPSTLEHLTLLDGLFLYKIPQLNGTIPTSLCSLPNLSNSIMIDCGNIICSCCVNNNFTNPIKCSDL
jgi:hypothetical protein